MENKNIFVLSMAIIVTLLISTMGSPIGLLILNDDNIVSTDSDPYPQIDVYKKVWNETSGTWDDEITVIKGTIVRFNVSVVYHDIDPEDTSCFELQNITIVDNLSDFEYMNNSNCSEPMVPHPDDFLIVDPLTNTYTWAFATSVTLAEIIPGFDNVMYLEFDVKANQTGTLVNVVNVSAIEHCCTVYCEDSADVIVNVLEPPRPDVNLEKYVKNNNNWENYTQVNVGNTVEFKITINNTGNVDLNALRVDDNLPSYLAYNYDANHTPSSASDHHIEWDFGILPVGQNIEITFTANAASAGTNQCNYAEVITLEGPTDNDTACVDVIQPPRDVDLEKYVKEGNNWVNSTTVSVGDDVEFKILVTNIGNGMLTSLLVKDDLPSFLTYNYDANYTPSSASDQHVEWQFFNLNVGETIEIIFSAHVDSAGDDCNVANVTTCEGPSDEDTACVNVTQPPGNLTCDKKVWDPDTQTWEDEITAEIGDTVRFNITFTYNGTLAFYNIQVKDMLPPCLEYADNANPVETAVNGKIIWWNLSVSMSHGESYSIEYDALVVSNGTNVNIANITGIECGIHTLYCEAEATVIVEEQPGGLICDKKVWDPDTQTWEDEVYANIGDTVTFKINVTYNGDTSVHSISIKDMLPPCLEYADNANPVETAVNGKIIWWNLSTTLLPGESVIVTFDASVVSEGTNVNVANVTGEECPPKTLFCQDTATVIVECGPPSLVCDKKVWDPDTQTWEDEITAEIGDTVRFNITFSYWGDLSFYNIWVLDVLPPCLKYADNAIPSEPAINGNKLLWYLTISLQYGESYSIEYDALVVSNGTNVNIANITGIECGIRELYCIDEATVIVEEPAEELVADANGPYSGEPNEIIDFSGSASGGVPPYVFEWDFNYDGVTFNVDATGKTPTHSWSSEGLYTIALRVTDNVGTKDIDTTTVTIETPNSPPLRPGTPEGPSEGKTKTDYTFSASTTDPDGDQIWYKWSWGDGNISGWIGPFNSGDTCEAVHHWTEKGTYEIKVKAKDNKGDESTWSPALEIGITKKARSRSLLIDFFERILEKFPMLERIFRVVTTILTSFQNLGSNVT